MRGRPGGGEERLALFGAGDYFGEMAPLFGLPRSATARASTAVTVTGYPLGEFRELLGVDHLRDLVQGRRERRRVKLSTLPSRKAGGSKASGTKGFLQEVRPPKERGATAKKQSSSPTIAAGLVPPTETAF